LQKKFDITLAINSNDSSRKEKILNQTENHGVDIAIIATGSLKALEDAFELVRKGGTIVMFGVPSRGDTMNIDMSKVYTKEISLTTSFAASDFDTKEALQLIESSRINVKDLITHKYSITECQKAFEHAHNGSNAMKIIITK